MKNIIITFLLLLISIAFVFANGVNAKINIEQVFEATITTHPSMVSTIVDNPLLCNNVASLNTNSKVILELEVQSNESSIIVILPSINNNVKYYNNLCVTNNMQVNLQLVKGFLLPNTYFGVLSMTSNKKINNEILTFIIAKKFE